MLVVSSLILNKSIVSVPNEALSQHVTLHGESFLSHIGRKSPAHHNYFILFKVYKSMLNILFIVFSIATTLPTTIPPLSALGGYILLAILAVVLIYIILILGKSIVKFILGLIINTILGVIALLLLDFVFSFGIPLTLPVIGATALFGLPGVGAIALLKLLGVISFI